MTAVRDEGLVLHIDGAQPISVAATEAVLRVCDRAEDQATAGLVTVHVWGAPAGGRAADLTVGLLTKWERAVRRLERLGLTTVAVASGDCGGPALDVLLATDVRIAATGTRLVIPLDDGATWPGMALYRLARQGAGRVRRHALLGEPIEAADAVALGLLDSVVADPGLELALLAEAAAGVAGRELAIRRQLLMDAARTSFEDALGSHLAACDRALRRGVAS
ncbi:enoyl-CoA-hydratase DpgB [Actinoplanes cyaneus]|uniref:enoyl-CoA-hydratase DpgB n=1 Tax=Actinoplanes cyaneus TaxID=52696 RepID=UPI001944DE3E|nr:enoyl-CoA-hydratase DpgB [Actinoplanes cyaneus]MCW2142223.1 (3,5-dihydroxycyclohex-3-enyl)acetyl-CoA dehydratase subunit B [Actinoplanes cyaneus]